VADERPRPREYRGESIAVTFDSLRCIHAEACVRGLPTVFDLNARPWVQLNRGNANEIADVVQQCPSGALTFKRVTFGAEERADEPPRIIVIPDGPLYVRGDFEYPTVTGEQVRTSRAALCRCGDSANKPFCDNSHVAQGFQAPEQAPRG